MPKKYKKIYATPAQYARIKRCGRNYVGFIIGVGYAFTKKVYTRPVNMRLVNPPKYVKPGEDRYQYFEMQCIDRSEEAVKMSYATQRMPHASFKHQEALKEHYQQKQVALSDNTRIDASYLARTGSTIEYDQAGGVIILGNSNWEPRQKARHVDGRPIGMSYSPPFQYKFAGWFRGLMKPQSNPQNWSDGDTLILNWNYRVVPALTIMNINNADTTFTPISDGVTPPYWYKPPTSYDYYKRIK